MAELGDIAIVGFGADTATQNGVTPKSLAFVVLADLSVMEKRIEKLTTRSRDTV